MNVCTGLLAGQAAQLIPLKQKNSKENTLTYSHQL